MQVTLTSEQERFVRSQIQSGHYRTPEDAIAEGLKLLEMRDRQQKEMQLEELRKEILVGTEEMRQGKVTDGEIVFERLQERLRNEFGLEE
ncbi:MAG: type II toxin-antitoxin system ParD family antitoxin [Cyanobacteria bacterium SBLK]|nr:type II toxin-antitoxin system ParD family antitoxin [Cyanobacteria bacterium SBLK]